LKSRASAQSSLNNYYRGEKNEYRSQPSFIGYFNRFGFLYGVVSAAMLDSAKQSSYQGLMEVFLKQASNQR
jgi:hypothetical protein